MFLNKWIGSLPLIFLATASLAGLPEFADTLNLTKIDTCGMRIWLCEREPVFIESDSAPSAWVQEAAHVLKPKGSPAQRWSSLVGPYGGYVSEMTIVPSASGPVIYVGTQGGGVYRSTDRAESWECGRDGLTNSFGYQVAVAPAPSDFVVYAACGFSHVWTTGDPGFFRSMDYGQSWTDVSPVSGALYWRAALVSRREPNVVLAGGSEGIYRSSDWGETWNIVCSNPGDPPHPALQCMELVCDPLHPDTIYAPTLSGYLWRSRDRGLRWEIVGYGTLPIDQITSMAVDPVDCRVLYCHGSKAAGGASGIFRSTDFGETWQQVLPCYGLPWPCDLRAHPSPEPGIRSVIWFAGQPNLAPYYWPVYKSKDDGATWIGMDPAGDLAMYSLAIDPMNPDVVYAGSYRKGVFKTTNGGDSWFGANYRLTNTLVTSVAGPPLQEDIIYAGCHQNCLWKTTDGGADWFRLANLPPYNINDLALYPNNPDIVFTTADNTRQPHTGGVWKSTDGGQTWVRWPLSNPPNGWESLWQIEFHPLVPDIVWASAYAGQFQESLGAYRSTNAGDTWELMLAGVAIAPIAVSPDGWVYAGTNEAPYCILRSTDVGQEVWESVYDSPGPMRALEVDAHNPDVVYASYRIGHRGYMIRSTDGGDSWDPVDLHAVGWYHAILSDSYTEELVHLSVFHPMLADPCQEGYYYSPDGAANWQMDNRGLWNASLVPLELWPRGLSEIGLLTGTFGAGAYLSLTTGGSEGGFQSARAGLCPTSSCRLAESFPNPSRGQTTISYQLPASRQVRLGVYSLSGQLVTTLVSDHRPAGCHAVVLQSCGMAETRWA